MIGDYDISRFTFDYIFHIRNKAISLLLKQKPTIILSRYEAEYIRQMQVTKKTMWLELLLQKFNTFYSINITGDLFIYLTIYFSITYYNN